MVQLHTPLPPLSSSHPLTISLSWHLSVRSGPRWRLASYKGVVRERQRRRRALARRQLFAGLQIASAVAGCRSGHQQAEELSKELVQPSLIHAWCTTRWQNTATTYGRGGRRQGARGAGGGAPEKKRGAICPILSNVN